MHRKVFLTFYGLETLAIGLYLFWQRTLIRDDPNDRIMHIAHNMNGLPWATVMCAVGVFVIVIGVFDITVDHVFDIAVILLCALWAAYFVTFLLQDIHFGQPIKLSTMMTGFVLLSIFLEARYGGDHR